MPIIVLRGLVRSSTSTIDDRTSFIPAIAAPRVGRLEEDFFLEENLEELIVVNRHLIQRQDPLSTC
jgi:hypothetical protein